MASVNKVILIGNLGRDPEVKFMANGDAVVNISLATSRNWKDKNSGEKMEETEWHRIVAYGRQAEVIGEYCRKGRPLYVEGRLKTRKWEKDGVDMYTTEIVLDTFQLLGGREDGDNDNGGQRQQRAAAPAPAQRQQRAAAPAPAPKSAAGFDDMDDDIPF